MRSIRLVSAGVVMSTVTLLAGASCGDRARSEEAGAAAAGATATAGARPARNACELLPAREVEALVGEPVEARPGESGPTHSACEYWGTRQQVPYLGVTAYWSGGKEQWDIRAAGTAMAGDMMRAAEGVELDSIVKPGPVPGVGDAAIYSELLPAVVLEGDRFLELTLFYLPDAKRHFRPLAVKLLERM